MASSNVTSAGNYTGSSRRGISSSFLSFSFCLQPSFLRPSLSLLPSPPLLISLHLVSALVSVDGDRSITLEVQWMLRHSSAPSLIESTNINHNINLHTLSLQVPPPLTSSPSPSPSSPPYTLPSTLPSTLPATLPSPSSSPPSSPY